MPDASAILDRAARASRIIFATAAMVAIAASLLLARGGSGSGGAWSVMPDRHLYVVTSGSMSPKVRAGDAVLVKPITTDAAKSLQPGEVVTFRAANNPRFLITHRIVASHVSAGGRHFYTTKGDANTGPDSSVLEPGRIIGVVTRVIPRLGALLVAIRTPGIAATFVAAFLLLEAAFLAFRFARTDDRTTQPSIP